MTQPKNEQNPIKKNTPPPEIKTPPNQPHCHCRCRRWTSVILIIIITIATYLLMQINQIQNTHQRLNTDIQTTLNTLTNEQKNLKEQLQFTTKQIETQQTQFQAQLQTVHNQLKITQDFEQDQAQPWQLRKAQYYLELAAINAHWTNHNQATSIALLHEVEQILQSIPDPRLDTLKKNIAADLIMIQATPTLDIPMILNTLDEAQANIETLPFETNAGVTTTTQQESGWQTHLQDSLNILKQIVIVHRDNVHTAPLLSPFYQTIIREKMTIDIQEAQWAILQNNADIYTQALNRIIEAIHQNFNPKASETQTLLEKITLLQQQSFETNHPNFNHSLSLINDLINDDPSSKIQKIEQPRSH